MDDAEARYRERMRALGKLGGERTKQLAAKRPGYFAEIGRLGGRAGAAAQRARLAVESATAASGDAATRPGPQMIAGDVKPIAAIAGDVKPIAALAAGDLLAELEATIQRLSRGS
jgi:hypothetical protein